MTGTPWLIGFYRAGPLPATDVQTVAELAVWCQTNGYTLGHAWRHQHGDTAFASAINALERDPHVAGLVVPSLDHLGPRVEAMVSRITKTGKRLQVVAPAPDRATTATT